MIKLKFIFLFLAYAILLVHNCIPHHHHHAEADANHHSKIDPGSSKVHHHTTHENHDTDPHHELDAHDHDASENPYSHFIHALDLCVFISNQSDLSFDRTDAQSSDILLASEFSLRRFPKSETIVFDFVESATIRLLFNHSGLRAPPIC